jgi:pimeloyl-ACP methyl ester carboxylesterase
LFAARHPNISRLILLTPAFDFYRLWQSELGPARISSWRQIGTIGVFHYGAGRELGSDELAQNGPGYGRAARRIWELPCSLAARIRALCASDYDLMEDAAQYEPFPDFTQPTLILHGERDPVVPIELSRTFAATHPNAKLVALSSGHELTDVLDRIWQHSKDFLCGA